MASDAPQRGQGSPSKDRKTSSESGVRHSVHGHASASASSSGVPETGGLRPLGLRQLAYASAEAERQTNTVSTPFGTRTWQTNFDANAKDTWWLVVLTKTTYFGRFAQQGVFYSYLAVFLVHQGFSLFTCGAMFAIVMLAQSFGSATVPMLANSHVTHTLVGVVSHAAGSLVMVLLVFVQGPQFITILSILGLGNFLVGGSGALVDNAVFRLVRTRGLSFGHQRLWGSIGWGLSSMIASQVINANGIVTMWYVYGLLTPFTTIAIAFLLSLAPTSRPPQGHGPLDLGTAKEISNFLSHPLVRPFLLSVFMQGVLFATATGLYMSVWAVVDLHADYRMLGSAAIVMSTCEIPIFLCVDAVGKRKGVHGALYIASLAYGVCLCFYGYLISDPWWIVPLQPLLAVAFALPIGLVGGLATNLAEEVGASNSTAQGLKQGASNAGCTVGFLVGGWLFEAYSARLMYRVFCFSSVVMFLAVVVLHLVARRRGKCELLYRD